MSICIVAGGTGGHIYPAMQLAEYLKKKGLNIIWAGSHNRLESKLLSNGRYEFNGFDIYRYKEDKLWLFKNLITMVKIFKYFKSKNVQKVFATGGYISFYFLVISKIMNIPFYLFEPNVIPGRVTKWFSKSAKKVFVGFKETVQYLKINNVKVTGIPVRSKIKNNSNGDKNHFLIFGGSQGSLTLNNAIKNLIRKGFFKKYKCNIYWITGRRDFKELFNEFKDNEKIKIFDYVADIGDMYKKSKLAITRAGALTIAELIESNTPAILIPYPYAKDNHQFYNAKILERKSGSIVINEDENLVNKLKKNIKFLFENKNIKKYIKNIKKIKFNNPEKEIYEELK